MKNLDTGKLSGPPTPHEEWKKHQDELAAKEIAAASNAESHPAKTEETHKGAKSTDRK